MSLTVDEPSFPSLDVVHYHRFLTTVQGTATFDGGSGAATVPFSHSDFLRSVALAQFPALDPASLALIYDRETQQLLVVNAADGSTVQAVYKLSDYQEVALGESDQVGFTPEAIVRADLLEPDGTTSVGSIGGLLHRHFDSRLGELDDYRWKADFQVLSPGGGAFAGFTIDSDEGAPIPMLLSGQFKVRKQVFVPGATPN